jgi:molecular chaperone DnaK
VVEVRSTAGDTHLGGDDFDRRIVDHLADEFQRSDGIDLRRDPQALQRLFEAGERAKVELSSVTQTTINLPFVTADANGPKHLNVTLTRATFEQLTADLVDRCLGPVERAMADAKVTANDIDEVILVGGSTRIPAVQKLVRRLTGGKDPNMTVNPTRSSRSVPRCRPRSSRARSRTSCCSTSLRCRSASRPWVA